VTMLGRYVYKNWSLFTCRSMSLPLRQLEAEKSSTKDKGRGGSPVETSVFYDEREDSTCG
jgi:hypothetical protein